ncbi:hypothetical protein D3C87_1816110 [compost metagenome]
MVWIESVRSRKNQIPKVTASTALKMTVLTQSSTPRLSVRLSVRRVPTMLIRTTTVQ